MKRICLKRGHLGAIHRRGVRVDAPTTPDLFDLAWREQKGYVCLSLRNAQLTKDHPDYWRDMIFSWPKGRNKLLHAIDDATKAGRDVYWSPAVYASPQRAKDGVIGRVHTLWADLDEVDPKTLAPQLKPTAAWESSPGRFQALWLLDKPLSPQEQTNLNQRLTYAIGADKGGWDLTQVLRTPGTRNYKYEDQPEVQLLYLNGHRLNVRALDADLPELVTAPQSLASLEDPKEVLARHKITARAKELIRARHAQVGTRSDRLWELECLLAEAGMDPGEIVSIVKWTVWNKFKGRNDELQRLHVEAIKAVAHAAPTIIQELPTALIEEEDVGPLTWHEFDAEHRPITWMVQDVWGDNEVGFISGLPKAYKSWVALDLAVSVASGTKFLGQFQAKTNNVLLIQEEDPRVVLQDRLVKIGAAKELVGITKLDETSFEMHYELPDNLFIVSNQGFTLTDEWLELLERWIEEREIKLLILDPLMMIAGGGFDEFKAFEFMEKVLKPLKRLRARTRTAIVLVHHHTKGSEGKGARDMYGSVALWAWEEAALHIQVSGIGKIVIERFSKHALLPPLTVDIGNVEDHWDPALSSGQTGADIYELLVTMESGATVEDLVTYTGLSRETITRTLRRLEKEEKATKQGQQRRGKGRPRDVWVALV